MNSLKAFKRIMEIYGNTNSLEGTYNDFLIIKKDLEVLEIIKERFIWLENGKLYCGRINDIHIPINEDDEGNEEMELLREWLLNDK